MEKYNQFERNQILDKIDKIDGQLVEEQSKKEEDRDRNREFELLYAKFIAGLKLNTGGRFF